MDTYTNPNNTTTKHSEVTMNSGSVEWLSNQTYELFEQYSEGNFDRITLNKLVLKATEQAKEMEVAGREMSYSDGYREGYKRALELIEWYIKNINKENK